MAKVKPCNHAWVTRDQLLTIRLSHKEVTVQDIEGIFKFVDGKSVQPKWASVDLSCNDLGDDAARTVFQYLGEKKIQLKVFKYFRNEMTDASLDLLTDLLRNQSEGIAELHLSDNNLSTAGATRLFRMIANSKLYPLDLKGQNIPVWIRIERNIIQPTAVLEILDKERISYCACEQRGKCCPTHCGVMEDNCPKIHLAGFRPQRTSIKVKKLKDGDSELEVKSETASWIDAVGSTKGDETYDGEKRAGGNWWNGWQDGWNDAHPWRGGWQVDGRWEDGNGNGNWARNGNGNWQEWNDWNSGKEWNEWQWEASDWIHRSANVPEPLRLPPGMKSESPTPLYIYLDSSAILKMAYPADRCLLSFEQMLFLCAHRIMAYNPRAGSGLPLMSVLDSERILFVITDVALDLLSDIRHNTEDPEVAHRIKWIAKWDDNSTLAFCHSWGILEIVESKSSTRNAEFSKEERDIARKCNVGDSSLGQVDFILNMAQYTNGRTLIVTGNTALVAYWRKHRPNHRVKCFDIDQVQAIDPEEWRLFANARCGREVELLNRSHKCFTADVLLRGLQSIC